MKPAYEGSHLTHNVSSHRRYINIMDKQAVKRFIDVAYNPIAERAPEVYKNAEAVFTDEPSLQSDYVAGYETWPYALIPWVEGLPEMFEQEYGHSLLPVLPRLFEATEKSYPTRVKFYRLVGKLIADIRNPMGLYYNYFLHVWRIYSYSPFANASCFTPAAPSVTSVEVTPATMTVAGGHETSVNLTAEVVTVGFAPKSVIWTSSNNKVSVDIYGTVTVAADATGTATITATSTFNSTKKDTCVITISA